MIGHSRDHVRLVFKAHAFLLHGGVRGLNVGNRKVKNGTEMIELRLLWTRQHQSHSAALEKGEPRTSLEEQLQPQHILVEAGSPLHVVCVDCNLSDARNPDSRCYSIHG